MFFLERLEATIPVYSSHGPLIVTAYGNNSVCKKKNETWLEAHSEPFQAFKIERFAKIINRLSGILFLLFAKRFISDVWQYSKYTSVSNFIEEDRQT